MKPRHKIALIALLFILPYILGWIFPEPWWATHYLAFLPTPLSYVFICFSGSMLLGAFLLKPQFKLPNISHWFLDLLLAIGFGALCYYFPIAVDNYGNARSLVPHAEHIVLELPEGIWNDLATFKLVSGNGRWGVFHVYTLIAYALELTYKDVFIWAGVVCGAAFVFTWLRFVKSRISNPVWKIALSIAGVISPFYLIFFGHIETYAPLYLILPWYFILLAKQIETKNPYLFIPLLILLVVGIRFHNLMNLFIPTLLLAGLNQLYSESVWFQKVTTFKGIFVWLLMPIAIAGLILYFFILGDHNDPRSLEGDVPDIERMFLPIISPDPPLDKYNLQSWNHISDFINSLLHWAPALLFLVGVVLVLYRKRLTHSTVTNIILFGLLVLVAFLFMFNPLMSMPFDWDLFVFPTPVLMVLAVLLVQNIQHEPIGVNLIPATLSIAILCVPLYMVNASRDMLSYRVESVGVHMYKTYYAHSSMRLLQAIGMIPDDLELYMKRKHELLSKLEPYAQPGIDKKYAELLTDDAIVKWRSYDQPEEAKDDFLRALYYYPEYPDNWYNLFMLNLSLGKPEIANEYLTRLATVEEYNAIMPYLKMHVAFELGNYNEALEHYENVRIVFGEDTTIEEIIMRLQANEPIDDLLLQLRW